MKLTIPLLLVALFLLESCEKKPKKIETMDEWIQRLKDEKPIKPLIVTKSEPCGDFGCWLTEFKDKRGVEYASHKHAKCMYDNFKFPNVGDTLK